MTIRILLADDQRAIRDAFRILLDSQPDMTVVAEAADGVSAVEQARLLRPDVTLVDIRMPRMDGLAVTRELAGPGVADPLRVVVVTTFDHDEYVRTALRDGACGFILKRSGPTLLAEAVRAAVAGDTLISPQVTVRLLEHHALAPGADSAPDRPADPQEPLTDRELAVVRRLARGDTNADIAEALSIAPGTVKNHLAVVQRKLGARNRVAIAAWAWGSGLVR